MYSNVIYLLFSTPRHPQYGIQVVAMRFIANSCSTIPCEKVEAKPLFS